MDIVETIKKRKSIRAFRPDAVPREVLKEIMEIAVRAPSWANTQPWEFAIVGGRELAEIRGAFVKKAQEPSHPDLAAPKMFPPVYASRHRPLGREIFRLKGITKEDTDKKKWWRQWMPWWPKSNPERGFPTSTRRVTT